VTPAPPALLPLARNARLVVVLEDGVRTGGVGASVSQLMRDADVDVPVRNFGIPAEFLDHGKRAEVLARIGLTAQDVSRAIVESVARLGALRPGQLPVDNRLDSDIVH
jgi:1-deoxy-D-xylulose-5-phosphate synthase